MHNEILSIQPSTLGQQTSAETQHNTNLVLDDSKTQNTTKKIGRHNNFNKYSTNRLDKTFCSQFHSFLRVCPFIIFASIAMAIGVITVCVTSSKPTNQTCRFIFIRSAQRQNGYNSRPHHIAMADFNEDNHQDIVVANAGIDNIGILLNNKNGTFAPQITYSTEIESLPYSVAVGDVNNVTHLDIIVANYGTNSIGVLLGSGDGTFANPIITSLGSSRPLSLVVGYLNNDAVLDIAVASYGTATIAILLGTNDGSFRISNVYDMGYDSIPYSLVLADLNYDNRLDIIVVNYGTSELAILLNTENGNFVMNKYWTDHDSQPSSVTTGDFNNDNTLDIAIAYSGSSSIGIFLGNRNGSFTNFKTYPMDAGSRPQCIDVGDFNNDTQLDIVVIDSKNDNLVVLKGYGNGSFSMITRHSTGYNSDLSSIIVGDFDNDHKLDIAITNNATNNVLILTSYLIYPVTNSIEYTTGIDSVSHSLDVADFNEDQYLDIVVSCFFTNNIGVFLNLGNETFTSQQTYDMGESSAPSYVRTGDVNNDNHSDVIVVMYGIDSIVILLGYGNGSFARGNKLAIGDDSLPSMVAIGDLDNDGNLDVITVNSGTGHLGLLFGFGDGTFTSLILLSIEDDFFAHFVGLDDVNNDKILDIVVSSLESDVTVAVLLGCGNRSFYDPMFISTDSDTPNTFAVGDLNNDHRLDIVYTSTSFRYVGVLLGNGDGTFETVTKYFSIRGSQPQSVSIGYYNDDAFVDIAVSNVLDYSINIYLGTGNGSFGTPTRLSTVSGFSPWSVLFADFNNDNQQDIGVANANDETSNIQIFFVYYEADFTSETSYTTGSGPHPVSVSVGDLNNDGKSNVVVANSGNDDIEVLLHYTAQGIFINRTIYSTGFGSHPQCVTIADFNKDHLFDIAVVNAWDNNMNIFVGLGKGSYDTRIVYSTGSASAPNSIVAGDLNNDSRMDVVIAIQHTDNVAVFLAFDYVSFTNDVVYLPGINPVPYYVATGDFNNDHFLDMAVVNFAVDTLGIYLGNDNGTFSDQIAYSTGLWSAPRWLGVGDFNNDSHLDIVVVNSFTENIGVFLGYGNGNFQSQISYSTGDMSIPYSAAIADLNNDSQLDIVVANYGSDNVWVFWGYGNGSFSGQIVYSSVNQSNPVWVAVDDLNNDKIPDIVVANNGANNVCIWFGYDNRSFGNIIMLSTGEDSAPVSIALGDFNGDKLTDVAVANQNSNSVGIFFGYGNGTFSSQKIYFVATGAYLSSIVASDINNDTILDILMVDYNQSNSSIGIFYGLGDGNFTLPKIYPTGLNSQPNCIATGDFNNDGKVDLTINYVNHDSIGVMIQVGSEPFASSVLFSTGNQSQPTSVAIGDFDNDDYLDIAVTNSATSNIGIFLGYGNGDFADQFTYSTGINSLPSSITVGHFNDDHHLDIAVVNTVANTIGIFLGYGNGRFINMTIYSTGVSSVPISIAVNDMNKDDHLDLVVANWGTNDVLMFEGIGDGTFLDAKVYSVGYNARPQSVAIGDVNNDDMLDIIVANYGTDYVEILLQTC